MSYVYDVYVTNNDLKFDLSQAKKHNTGPRTDKQYKS